VKEKAREKLHSASPEGTPLWITPYAAQRSAGDR